MRTATLVLFIAALTTPAHAQKVWTADDLFRRNIGTREDQDTPFTPHKIIGNLYYVGTRSLGSFRNRTLSVLIIGSVGVNPGMKVVGNADYPTIAQDFQRSFAFLRSQHPDIPLGSHPGMYNMNEKFAKLGRGGASPYVDPAGYVAEL